MRKNHLALALAVGFLFAVPAGLMLSFRAHGQTLPPAVAVAVPEAAAPVKTLGVVTVQSGQPTSLPTQIPTTMEGATREQIKQIERTVHATDSEDAIKSLELAPVPAAQRHG